MGNPRPGNHHRGSGGTVSLVTQGVVVGRKASIFGKRRGNKPNSGRLNRSLIDQHDRESIPHWVHAVAFVALQRLWIRFAFQRLVADGASQKFK